MVPVKVCGITRLDDALLAAKLGAAWIGFIFWSGSPRFVQPKKARAILDQMPPHVSGVGVFVNQPTAEINRIADQVGLGSVQLHGNESEAECEACNRRVIKAIAFSAQHPMVDWQGLSPQTTVLVDAFDSVKRGGTGRLADWQLAAAVAVQRPLILSGGLRAENVVEAVRQVSPYGLDVSSGIESEPGIKSSQLMRSFFRALGSIGSPLAAPVKI
ncbi:MAG: phosphoribosylanthranilate isomerase [Acidobacteria bacterium]|nr:phosphoribosylanthranilate isomerase [Acidobacteriota bacterium]